jgi:diguanylate cyclase (GGDEF)-like protein
MTLQSFKNSLATRIILLGVAIVFLSTVARYFLLSQYLREDIGALMAAQQLTLANYVARDVEHEILQRKAAIRQMAGAMPTALLKQPGELRNWLDVQYNQQPLFVHGLVVVEAGSGQVLARYPPRTTPTAADYGDASMITTALAGDPTVGRPFVDSVSHAHVMPIAQALADTKGVSRAVLVGITALDAAGFLSFTEQDRIGQRGGLLMMSPLDRLFIASTDTSMVLKPTPPDGTNLLHDRAMQGYRGSGITVNAQGEEEISGIAPVPSTGWFVVARIPTDEAFSVVARTQRYVAKNSVFVVLVFLVLSSALMLHAFRPLLQAADQADRMTRGDAPLEPLAVVRSDEVGHLTEAFNRLLAKLQESQLQMVHMAHHDVLTGLPNRALMADRLAQALARSDRNGSSVGFLYIDLDDFKPINDGLGHKAGDEALVEVARRLLSIVRESDTLARTGGDEFVLLLGELEGDYALAQSSACKVAAKCLDAIAAPFLIQGQSFLMGVSIGIAIRSGKNSAHELQIAADAAMYQAKQGGGHRYVVAPAAVATPT